ncbi:biotin--[acetyl-CoA-carboxylase] ligase [Paenibacillus sp. IB182496]|uniref:Bifunctional ligase/repressor BirA n=1 Tax=Paenibacillus sabuli TaxID=2772509 RepID=A0A927GR16_9BACL|nr:biotin--[acetyl-CoA-carboxylase] ligase [Paenibacillus sabuli]MBD2845129.1 biotin--[acetyl-CoA-carboxylase] ligase [Paenibacillus sabuli]
MSERLLRLLSERQGEYVSGEAISKQLQVSRTAVWKQIRKLQEKGYRFEASPRLGYRLLEAPAHLEPEEIMSKLSTKRLGRRIERLEAVPSTQDIAHQLAAEGAPEGTLVLAEQQLKGRGRMGRGWVSPRGKGIWMSLVLRPRLALPFAPQLTLLTAVALCRSLRRMSGAEIGIKWPNDLLIDGKKISGILLESTAEEERIRYVIAGIGISVNLEADDYPDELLQRAVSLRMATGRSYDRTALIVEFLDELEQLYDLFAQEGFAPIRSLWEALSVSLHRPATLTTPQGVLTGVPVGLAESGALLVRLGDGEVRAVFSAEMGASSSGR